MMVLMYCLCYTIDKWWKSTLALFRQNVTLQRVHHFMKLWMNFLYHFTLFSAYTHIKKPQTNSTVLYIIHKHGIYSVPLTQVIFHSEICMSSFTSWGHLWCLCHYFKNKIMLWITNYEKLIIFKNSHLYFSSTNASKKQNHFLKYPWDIVNNDNNTHWVHMIIRVKIPGHLLNTDRCIWLYTAYYIQMNSS